MNKLEIPTTDIFTGMMKQYAIWDTKEKKWWQTPKGKMLWRGRSHAANAVNANPPEWMAIYHDSLTPGKTYQYRTYRKFKQQSRLVIVEATYMLQSTAILY